MGFGTGENYIISTVIPFRRRIDPFILVVGMAGVKLGDHFAQVGCAHGGRLAAIARQVGLSGRAVAVAPDTATATLIQKAASKAGVLVEVEAAPPTKLPLDDDAFDLVVFDNTAGLLSSMSAEDRAAAIAEARRVTRPGGRVMVIGSSPRSGLTSLFSSAPTSQPLDPAPLLAGGGLKAPRTLADRDGLVFVEAVKPRTSA
jgi:ubiquinone/menaquinone biosynthesis C-methylase UbiE